jgi:putative N6-adenine-specific DNA methylase
MFSGRFNDMRADGQDIKTPQERRLMADHKRFKQHREFRERLDDDPEERMRDRREERRNAFSRRGGEDNDRRSRFADRDERPARRPSSRNPFAPHAEEGERGGRNEWREERREGRNEGFREKRGFKGGKDFGHKNYGKGGGRKDFGRGNKGRTYGDEED